MAPKLVFFYTYNCGGLADMIKGASTVWWMAKQTGREFAIEFKHELGVLYPKMLGRRKTPIAMLSLIDGRSSDGILELLNSPEHATNDIAVMCNVGLDHFTKYPEYLKSVLPFFQTFYTETLPIKSLASEHTEPFQVLHCRMGDLHLTEATNKSDNRIGSNEAFMARLQTFLSKFDPASQRTLICCDNDTIRKELLKAVPNSFSVCTRPYHFAYNTRIIPQREIMESIRETMGEHELMSHGTRIIMMAYSGFPIVAALMGGKELIILDEKEAAGWKHYKSNWTL